MEKISYSHPYFDALFFSVDEDNCLIEPLIISLWDLLLRQEVEREEKMEQLINELKRELENPRLGFFDIKPKKNFCQFNNKYIKRKFRY